MTDAVQSYATPRPRIRRLEPDQPWTWLAEGWRDIRSAPRVSFAYGAVFAGFGLFLTAAIWLFHLSFLVLPLAAGFMLVGPILAVGLYEVSRRLARGEPVSLRYALAAWRRNSGQLAFMGVLLMLFQFAWIRLAVLLFFLFFGINPPRPEALSLVDLMLTPGSIPFLALGTILGGILAAIVFSISVISIPMLLDRQCNVVTAIVTSIAAVRQNFWAMALWAWLIALFIGAGLVTFFLGLIVTLPLVAHATWHAYRDVVAWDDGTDLD